MFLKTNLGYLSQIALKNMQLLIQITNKRSKTTEIYNLEIAGNTMTDPVMKVEELNSCYCTIGQS